MYTTSTAPASATQPATPSVPCLDCLKLFLDTPMKAARTPSEEIQVWERMASLLVPENGSPPFSWDFSQKPQRPKIDFCVCCGKQILPFRRLSYRANIVLNLRRKHGKRNLGCFDLGFDEALPSSPHHGLETPHHYQEVMQVARALWHLHCDWVAPRREQNIVPDHTRNTLQQVTAGF